MKLKSHALFSAVRGGWSGSEDFSSYIIKSSVHLLVHHLITQSLLSVPRPRFKPDTCHIKIRSVSSSTCLRVPLYRCDRPANSLYPALPVVLLLVLKSSVETLGLLCFSLCCQSLFKRNFLI
jgi:hypothetical protein